MTHCTFEIYSLSALIIYRCCDASMEDGSLWSLTTGMLLSLGSSLGIRKAAMTQCTFEATNVAYSLSFDNLQVLDST